MHASDAFDAWARQGKDEGMAARHWHTAKDALGAMPVEAGDVVLDLGCGSGYAGRALVEARDAARSYGLDASPEMARNARSYTTDRRSGYLVGDFQALPFASDSIDHCFSMEAFYYARDPAAALAELQRVLRSGGTFACAVDYWEENHHSHDWEALVDIPMTRWAEQTYREQFRDAGFHVAAQRRILDTETEVPPAAEFPTEAFDSRESMVEHLREFGTLLTVGVVP
jgi:ubiquinone/menaquinone biosynthesis C-methylase UbiE